nr:hypothetical protein [Tanacetum cinerariifolium]
MYTNEAKAKLRLELSIEAMVGWRFPQNATGQRQNHTMSCVFGSDAVVACPNGLSSSESSRFSIHFIHFSLQSALSMTSLSDDDILPRFGSSDDDILPRFGSSNDNILPFGYSDDDILRHFGSSNDDILRFGSSCDPSLVTPGASSSSSSIELNKAFPALHQLQQEEKEPKIKKSSDILGMMSLSDDDILGVGSSDDDILASGSSDDDILGFDSSDDDMLASGSSDDDILGFNSSSNPSLITPGACLVSHTL